MSSVGSFFSYINDVRSHEPEIILAFVSYGILFWWKETDGKYFRTNIGNLQYILIVWSNTERRDAGYKYTRAQKCIRCSQKPSRSRTTWHTWESNIKADLEEIILKARKGFSWFRIWSSGVRFVKSSCKRSDWIQKAKNFLSSRTSTSLSRSTLCFIKLVLSRLFGLRSW